MVRTGAFFHSKSCTKMKRVLIDVESYTGTPTLRYCIICIKSAIYNEMCRDAQGYTGRGTMSLYFRPLRNLQQPSALAPGCFGMRRTRARSWTTYTKTARTTVRSWAVARSQGPPRAAPRCRKRSAAESRPGYPFAGGQHESIRKCLYLN